MSCSRCMKRVRSQKGQVATMMPAYICHAPQVPAQSHQSCQRYRPQPTKTRLCCPDGFEAPRIGAKIRRSQDSPELSPGRVDLHLVASMSSIHSFQSCRLGHKHSSSRGTDSGLKPWLLHRCRSFGSLSSALCLPSQPAPPPPSQINSHSAWRATQISGQTPPTAVSTVSVANLSRALPSPSPAPLAALQHKCLSRTRSATRKSSTATWSLADLS